MAELPMRPRNLRRECKKCVAMTQVDTASGAFGGTSLWGHEACAGDPSKWAVQTPSGGATWTF
eukprot:1962776-Pyramimonas_sp.AAC.1